MKGNLFIWGVLATLMLGGMLHKPLSGTFLDNTLGIIIMCIIGGIIFQVVGNKIKNNKNDS